MINVRPLYGLCCGTSSCYFTVCRRHLHCLLKCNVWTAFFIEEANAQLSMCGGTSYSMMHRACDTSGFVVANKKTLISMNVKRRPN